MTGIGWMPGVTWAGLIVTVHAIDATMVSIKPRATDRACFGEINIIESTLRVGHQLANARTPPCPVYGRFMSRPSLPPTDGAR